VGHDVVGDFDQVERVDADRRVRQLFAQRVRERGRRVDRDDLDGVSPAATPATSDVRMPALLRP
jgi:hypothetical protein